MLLTEEEAGNKWCHRSNPTQGSDFVGCGGSNCMAWRWEEARIMTTENYNKLSDEEKKPKGYCGLAGKV